MLLLCFVRCAILTQIHGKSGILFNGISSQLLVAVRNYLRCCYNDKLFIWMAGLVFKITNVHFQVADRLLGCKGLISFKHLR